MLLTFLKILQKGRNRIGESAAIKLYNRDKKDGYWVPSDTNLYASYIFKPNDPNISVLDKLYLHGRNFCGDNLDGRQFCLLYLFA